MGQVPADRPIAVRNLNSLLPQGTSNPFQEQFLCAAHLHRGASKAEKRFDCATAIKLNTIAQRLGMVRDRLKHQPIANTLVNWDEQF